MLKLTFCENDRKVDIYPIYTNNNETDYYLRKLEKNEMKDFIKFLFKENYKLNLKKENYIELTNK